MGPQHKEGLREVRRVHRIMKHKDRQRYRECQCMVQGCWRRRTLNLRCTSTSQSTRMARILSLMSCCSTPQKMTIAAKLQVARYQSYG